MAFTVVITRDVEGRYRGLLASAMLEGAAGVYVSIGLSRTAREHLWEVLQEWHSTLGNGSILMLHHVAGQIVVHQLGEAPRIITMADGLLLTRLRGDDTAAT